MKAFLMGLFPIITFFKKVTLRSFDSTNQHRHILGAYINIVVASTVYVVVTYYNDSILPEVIASAIVMYATLNIAVVLLTISKRFRSLLSLLFSMIEHGVLILTVALLIAVIITPTPPLLILYVIVFLTAVNNGLGATIIKDSFDSDGNGALHKRVL